MKVGLERVNNNFKFEATGKTGVPIMLDNTSEANAEGASPMELLLMGVGGCSAIDVINILKKQRQDITKYTLEVEGSRKEYRDAKVFENIHVKMFLEGTIANEKARRAAELSFEKYCSVALSMKGSVTITYDIHVNGTKV